MRWSGASFATVFRWMGAAAASGDAAARGDVPCFAEPTMTPRLSETVARPAALVAATALVASALSACYVLPIDPRTGQPYPPTSRDGYVGAQLPSSVQPPVLSVPPVVTVPAVVDVRLYPVNTQANRGGLLKAQVLDNNAGHGAFTVSYLGDTLQGESSRVDAAYAPFGRIYQQVFGTSLRVYNGRRGIANAFGAKGTNAQCEYVITGPGSGTGVCQFSDGANFQMYFGG